jgi:hypothetical protein
MLVLSIILGLYIQQVDYTAAFLHAPIDVDPDYYTLHEEEKKQSGVSVELHRGFPPLAKY